MTPSFVLASCVGASFYMMELPDALAFRNTRIPVFWRDRDGWKFTGLKVGFTIPRKCTGHN